MLFQPFTIKNVTFKNRILRSSIGGRTSYWDGTVTPAWKNFESRFAAGGIGGIISATISVHARRMSPPQYPTIHDDRYIGPLSEGIRAVQAYDCRYIMQIGDTGGHTHMSLFPEPEDAKSASPGFDLLYGYRNRLVAMTREEIARSVEEFAAAALRVKRAGCDGIEVTASKGYLIHQFLNPATNRRRDEYGGSTQKRFRFLKEIVLAVREAVGKDYLFGIRLCAKDYNYLPVNIRLPLVWPPRHYFIGNTLKETVPYAQELERLGVDYLHIDSGFGFPNPLGNPGTYPAEGFRLFVNATSHLSAKARARAMILNLLPGLLTRAVLGIGWRPRPGENTAFAAAFKKAVNIPVIANGGFQKKSVIDGALSSHACDLITMARPLLANPDLLSHFRAGLDEPENGCTFCSQCCTRTAVEPLGCYDPSRFTSQDEMAAEILRWSSQTA